VNAKTDEADERARTHDRRPAHAPLAAGADVTAAGKTTPLAGFVPQFKALASPTRAAIVEQLLEGERCVCEITTHLGMSQPLVSHHLAVLRAAGLLRSRGQGARTYYALDWGSFSEGLAAFTGTVEELHGRDRGPSCVCG
jgi:DNA-binding transcriptional ArsR family regulator